LQLFAQDNPVTNSATIGEKVTLPSILNGVVGGAYTQSTQVNSQLVPIMEWTIPNCYVTSSTDIALVPGTLYRITSYVASDDFTNVGAPSNATGVFFYATGKTPTAWTSGSTLTAILAPLNFGDSDSGVIPLSIDRGTTTIRRGCSLFVSTTSGYLTAPAQNQWCIRATYK
jgi:hypothetical protein